MSLARDEFSPPGSERIRPTECSRLGGYTPELRGGWYNTVIQFQR